MSDNEKQKAIYEDVESELRRAIENGGWKPGFKLPSERELAERFQCARMTVRRALQELQAEGLIARRHGSGSYVADLQPMSNILSIKDIYEEIASRGHVHHSVLLSRKTIRASVAVAAAMGIEHNARVFQCKLVHYENGTPVQFEERFVNPEVVPEFMTLDLGKQTPSSYLFKHAPLTAAEQVVEAVNADETMATHLGIAVNAALLKISRRTISQDKVASLANLYHPGNCYRIIGKFSVA
ncbi:histidine utilization repressor [Alcaligenaceae bacterium]|nr:histidine utilization repressor [Alcaligenaceae bacterium]